MFTTKSHEPRIPATKQPRSLISCFLRGANKNQQGLVLEALNRVWAAPWSFLGGSWALLGKSIEKRPRVITKMCCFGIPKSRPKSIKIDAKKHRVFKHVFFTMFCEFLLIFESKFRLFFERFFDLKRKRRFCKN